MMKQEFETLMQLYLEGELSDDDAIALCRILKSDAHWVDRLKQEAQFQDLLEQELAPHRSMESFLAGLATRADAEKTGDEFLESLLQKLQETSHANVFDASDRVWASEEMLDVGRPKKRPSVSSLPMVGGLAAAAAITLLLVLSPWQRENSGEALAKITRVEDVVWETPAAQGEEIEWEDGTPLKAGQRLRLRSGRARIQLENGNVITVEGPVDFRLVSESEGVLDHGLALARVGKGQGPFVFRGDQSEIRVEGSTTGVQADGSSMIATNLSDSEQVGIAGEALQTHLEMLSGIEESSQPVKVAVPGTLAKVHLDDALPVLIVREETLQPIEMKGPGVEQGLARVLGPSKAAIEAAKGKGVRSYVVQVGERDSANEGDPLEGSVTFDQRILEVKPIGGSPNNPLGFFPDQVEIKEDGRTLRFRAPSSSDQGPDKIRVFVEGE
ncbi:MAG: hypothetical protein AAGJ31_01510 [Verrucomicrobiota bacterium]